jgi:cytochrome c oxidase subunit 2
MYKVVGSLLATALIPSLAHAFQMEKAHRNDYMGLTPHDHWQEVWHETMWDITIIGIIFTVISVTFMVIYRRKEHGERGHLPALSNQAKIGWVVLPCMLFLGDDLYLYVKGFDLHNHLREVPADAVEVKVTASMWNWNYVDQNGIDTDGDLVVEQGKAVVLRMTSEDVVHSHYLNRYRNTEDVMPGRVTYHWFMPDELGESVVACREYCGAAHSNMYGKIIVKSPADYKAWVAEQTASAAAPANKNIASAKASALTVDNI